LKCFECDQKHFIHAISKIIDGKEYEEIEGFTDLLELSNTHTVLSREITIKDAAKASHRFKSHLYDNSYPSFLLQPKLERDGLNQFRQVIIDIVMYNLTEFLMNNNRQKLKKCSHCDQFYIANRLRRDQKYCSICSRKNKMSAKERAEYMKSYRNNPAKKRADAKKKREKKIKHLMLSAGKTRKQAEEIVDQEV